MIELRQNFGLSFEVLYRLRALALIGEHLNHFFDGAEPICKTLVARLIDRAHPATADALDDRIPVEQQRSRFELLIWYALWFLRLGHTVLDLSASRF
jgi:hypothetical protein